MASMATIAKEDMQILVHTTAPSRGQDDVRYRALAQAYIDFEPVNHSIIRERRQIQEKFDEVALGDEEGWVDTEVDESSSQLQHELQQSTQDERESEASYEPEDGMEPETASTAVISTQDRDLGHAENPGYAYSPLMSFQSVEGNLNSPPIRDRCTFERGFPDNSSHILQNSWQQPPSTVADSQPQHVPANLPSSPSRIWEVLDHVIGTPGDPTPAPMDNSQVYEYHNPAALLSSKDSILAGSEYVKSSEVNTPDHPSSLSSLRKAGNSEEILRSRSPNIFSQEQTHPLKRKTLTDSHKNISPSIEAEPGAIISFITTDVLENSSKRLCLARSGREESRIGMSLVPQTQLGQFWTMQSEADECRIVDSQKEVSIVEETRFEESRVDIDHSSATKTISSSKATEVITPSPSNPTSFWADVLEVRPPPPKTSKEDLIPERLITPSLQQFVRKFPAESLYQVERQVRDLRAMERGYWLVNSQAWDERLRRSFWDYIAAFINKGHGGWGLWSVRDKEFKSIRVYCWGITVKHVYLLLHISSGNKIKGTESRWIDGKGEDIIIMP